MEPTAYRQSVASRARDVDHTTSDLDAMAYRLARADRVELSPHDPIPLFLSDPDGEPDPGEFASFTARPRTGITTQIVAGVLALSAIAVLVALFQSDISRLFVLNAKAEGQVSEPVSSANAPVVRQIPLKDAARVSNPVQFASADARDVAPPPTPSREAIASAYQSALQAQAPAVAPAPTQVAAPPPQPAPAAPAKTLDAETLAGLMNRARSLMAIGDIAAARLLLERAANAQDAAAAFLLAQTYDPAVLGTNDTRSIIADPATARDWYKKAAQLGSGEAKQRLAQIQN